MSNRPFVSVIVLFLTIVIVTPSAFFVATPRAHALFGVADTVFDIPTEIKTALTAIQDTLIEAHSYVSAAAEYAGYINTYVLQPLAFVLSGNLMKALTASVVKFVIGKANGTGIPQFTVNVNKSLQTLSDAKNRAFISQIGLTNSPFSSSISSALNTSYLQRSSLSGFWAANMNTLKAYSPNVNAYLAGNWSQGGVAEWFALTTQPQNNPYMLYQNSQSQLASVIGPGAGGATGARLSELSWGQGFLSWCSVSDSASQNQNAAMTAYLACQANCPSEGDVACSDTCQANFEQAGGTWGTAGAGVNPGDACTNSNGTQGTIQTPGSTIKATLDKVLGGQQDKLAQMGNIGSQITGILSDISQIMQTVNLAKNILGGSGGTGGLLNAGQSSGALAQFGVPTNAATGSYGGVTANQINQDAATSSATAAASGDMGTRVKMYQTAWNTIGTAANTASTTVVTLISVCTTNADSAAQGLASSNLSLQNVDLAAFITAARAQAADAQTALANEIAPVVAKAAAAPGIASAALTMNAKVTSEIGTSAYSTDLQTLMTMPPTGADVSSAQQDAQTYDTGAGNAATATPTGSLSVSGSTVVDRMNLINTNALALQTTVCDPKSSLYTHSTGK
ncbi:MAG: hypothetical protein ACHQU0_00185 [Candidatus Paceibacteria bacterium]